MTKFIAAQNYSIIAQLQKSIDFIAKTELSIEKVEQLLNPNSLLRKYITLYNMNDQLDQALLNNAKIMNQMVF